jgi:hypothetical protein
MSKLEPKQNKGFWTRKSRLHLELDETQNPTIETLQKNAKALNAKVEDLIN